MVKIIGEDLGSPKQATCQCRAVLEYTAQDTHTVVEAGPYDAWIQTEYVRCPRCDARVVLREKDAGGTSMYGGAPPAPKPW